MKCSVCKKALSDDTLKIVVVEHRANGLNCLEICQNQKCKDILAFYLLGINRDKKLHKQIIKMIKEG